MARTTRISAILSILMVLGLVGGIASPASAHHKTDHTQGGGNSASDHDGDADSDETTAMEDSHTPEPDASPTPDNQHPSGKDRSAENGGSGNQGKAESNPDDSKGPMRYEGGLGDDKPGGPGGNDRDDQDGNNGCGNDDDFDDDNNGHCGGKRKPPKTDQLCPAGTDRAGMPYRNLDECEDDDVLPKPPITRKLCPAGMDNAGMEYEDLSECDDVDVRTDKVCPAGTDFAGLPMGNRKDCVLGTVIQRGTPDEPPAVAPQAILPFTGAGSVSSFLIAGIALITAGLAALKVRSSK